MAKKLILSILLFVFAAASVNAQTTERVSPNPQDRTVEIMQQRLQTTQGELVQKKVSEFRERIAQIQDAQKKLIVEKIADKISSANTNITARMLEALDKLEIILNRVEKTAENLATTGINTTTLLSTIVAAESSIENAREAVILQSEKEYTANITTDVVLRGAIGAMVSEFKSDITRVFTQVQSAKVAVQNAISEAKMISNDSTDATSSASIDIQ